MKDGDIIPPGTMHVGDSYFIDHDEGPFVRRAGLPTLEQENKWRRARESYCAEFGHGFIVDGDGCRCHKCGITASQARERSVKQ